MSDDNTLEIDGSVLEGGGQIFRLAVALSVLQELPIKIFNIRAKRSKPGLTPQHLKGLELVKEMTGGKLIGAHERSMEVTFKPGELKPGHYLADTGTAGSVGLILQMILPCALFSSGNTMLDLRGGTNVDKAPQIDYTTTVFLRLLEKFGGSFTHDLILRGFYPQGGGIVKVEIPPVQHLTAVELTDPGTLTKIWGTALTAGTCPVFLSKAMGGAAETMLRPLVPDITPCIEKIKESPDKAVGRGYATYLFAETSTGCVMGGTALFNPVGNRKVSPHIVGQTAVQELVQAVQSRVCLDSHAQDQMIILMALAKGKSRVLTGPITLHTETAIHIAQLMTKAKFTIHQQDGNRNIIECEGIGLENKNI